MTRFATIFVLAALVRPAPGAPATNPVDPAGDLRDIGLRVGKDLAKRFPGASGDPEHGDIMAIGACTRPTVVEREALTKLVTQAIAPEPGLVAFGCKESSGIVVDVAFDKHAPSDTLGDQRTGVWRVYRASAPSATATLTTLVDYQGTSTQDFMEWANEVRVATQVLVDLDGDGTLDALIASDHHEGGSRQHDVTLKLWRSRDRKLVDLGTYDDSAWLVAGSRVAPFVLEAERTNGNGVQERRYRCVSAEGVVDICPAVVQARHVSRMFEIAGWFVYGHQYEPMKSALPDRELAAQLLTELELPPAEQRHLLAELPPTTPEVRVARDIARFLVIAAPTKYGEMIEGAEPPPDPRPARIQALLGDAPCEAAPARVVADVGLWIRAHDADALLTRGDCKRGKACPFSQPSAPVIASSCVDGARGYVLATWHYDDTAHNEQLSRAVVFSLAPALTPLMTSTGRDMLVPCSACGGDGTGNWLDVEFHRRGSQLIATIVETAIDEVRKKTSTLSTFVDGRRGASVPVFNGWGQLGEPYNVAKSVIELPISMGVNYAHFDGATWAPVIEVPYEPTATLPASASRAAKYLFDEARRTSARTRLQSFDPARWARDRSVRAATRRDLVFAGASVALLARIDSEAAATK